MTAFNLAAAAPPTVTEADIERARQQHRMPTEAELARVPVPAPPRIDKLPHPVTRPPMDLEAIAKGFDLQAGSPALKSPDGPRVLIFVSFAMPEATLRRLVDQAARAGATLVLRGLVNGSIRETVTRMQGLIGDRQVAVQIDPQAFDRYGVVRTPTFVLVNGNAKVEGCTTGVCSTEDPFAKVAGDVTLDYAMRQMTNATRGNRGAQAGRIGQAESKR
jgi:conjugal transfer pilus assembly protein TrbC